MELSSHFDLPERNLWATVLAQSVEDLRRGVEVLNLHRELVEVGFATDAPDHVNAAWEVLREAGTYQSAMEFTEDPKSLASVCGAIGCSVDEVQKQIDALPQPAVSITLAVGRAISYLDRACPKWRAVPNRLPEGRRDTLATLREQFPGL